MATIHTPTGAISVSARELSDAIRESLSQQVPLADFKGTYVVTDTNNFLSSLDLIERIVWPDTGNEDMVLYIPWMAIQELDNIMNRKKGPLSNSAKCAVTFIYEVLSSKNPRLRGQTVVEARRIDEILRKDGSNINDDHFLHCCLEIRKQGSKVLLMSNDRNLRNKAMVNGIETVSADEMAKKLGLPIVKRDCRRTSPSASSTKQEKPSLLLSKDSGFTFGAWQKQKEAVKETSAESNIPTCSVPSRVPDEGTILMEVREILRRSLDLVLQSELESAFGALWLHVIKFKPPWTAETALQCIRRHWTALTDTAFKKSIEPVISSLLSKLSSNCGAGECASTAELAMQLCSEFQLHYPQLAGDVARLKQLSESQQASPGSSAAQLDGQSSTPPDLDCSHPLLNTDSGSPSSDVRHTETRGQQSSVATGQRQTPAAHSPPHGTRLGQQGVDERWPLRPLKEAQLGVPQLPPQQPRLLTPDEMFQESFAIVNEYWGSIARSGMARSRPLLNADSGTPLSDVSHTETQGQQNTAGQPQPPPPPPSPPRRLRLPPFYDGLQDIFPIFNDYWEYVCWSQLRVEHH